MSLPSRAAIRRAVVWDPAGECLIMTDSAGFDAICDNLAGRIGASRLVVKGAGHEVQFAGRPLNDALLALWRSTSSPAT
jgi:hypothetical protein